MVVVHESSPSDMWYHDTLVAFSILEIDVHNLRKDRLDEAGPIIIHEILKKDNSAMRELIRDRYVFEREIERRLGIIHGY